MKLYRYKPKTPNGDPFDGEYVHDPQAERDVKFAQRLRATLGILDGAEVREIADKCGWAAIVPAYNILYAIAAALEAEGKLLPTVDRSELSGSSLAMLVKEENIPKGARDE